MIEGLMEEMEDEANTTTAVLDSIGWIIKAMQSHFYQFTSSTLIVSWVLCVRVSFRMFRLQVYALDDVLVVAPRLLQ